MEPVPINPSPKLRYVSNGQVVKAHREMTQSDTFQRAVDSAMLQYQFELSGQRVDGSGAAANHFKLTGALEFIHLLKCLAEPPQQAPKPKDFDNLART